ncbi:MAG: hypothetical protein WC723_03395 [Candidatus Omnitrophota bacterium]
MKNKKFIYAIWNNKLIDYLIILVFSIIPFRKIMHSGFIIKLDLEFPLDLWHKAVRDFYIWDPWVDLGREIMGWWPHIWATLHLLTLTGAGVDSVEKISFIVPIFISGFGAYLLCRHIVNKNRIASIAAALIYMLNPWVYDRIAWGHYTVYTGYTLTPLVLLFLIKSLEKPSRLNYVLTALIFSLQCIIEIYMAYVTALAMFLYFLLYFVINWDKKERKQILKHGLTLGGVVTTVVLLSGMYLILPSLYFKLNSANIFLNSAKRIWLEDLYGFSQQNIFLNIIRLRYFRFSFLLNVEQGITNPFYTFLTFIPVFSVIGVSFFYRRNKYIMPFLATCLIFLGLSFGTYLPFNIYEFLWYHFPGFVAFRNSNTWISMVCLCYSVLIGILIQYILNVNKGRILKFVLLVIISVSLFINSWPMLTGDLNHQLKALRLPHEYDRLYAYFSVKERSKDFRMLIIPYHYGIYSTWANDNIHNPFYISPPCPIVIGSGKPYVPTQRMLDLLQNIVRKHQPAPENLGKFLGLFNIKYILVHKDIDINESPWFSDMQQPSEIIDFLKTRPEFRLIIQGENFCVFENLYYIPLRFFSTDNIISVAGNRDIILLLSAIPDFSFNKGALIFVDQTPPWYKSIERSRLFILHNTNLIDLMFANAEGKYSIEPINHILPHSNPEEHWCGSFFYPAYAQPICPLNHRGEYSISDFVFSIAEEAKLELPFRVSRGGSHEIWAHVLRAPFADTLKVYVDNEKLQEYSPDDREFKGLRWVKLGEVNLKGSLHNITIIKKEKYKEALIDNIVIIPKEEVEYLEKETLRHLTEYHGKMAYSISYGFGSVHTIFVPHSGNFILASKGLNTVKFFIDSDCRKLIAHDKNGYYYTQRFWLTAGLHTLSVADYPKGELSGHILLYQPGDKEENPNIANLFLCGNLAQPAPKIKEFNPTLFRVKLDKKNKGILVFGESSSPAWEARAGNTKLERATVYSCLNGYFLGSNGDNSIQLNVFYVKQLFRYIGLTISLSTFLLIIVFLTLWIRKRE